MLITPEKLTVGLAQVLHETHGFETVCSSGKPSSPTLMTTFTLDTPKMRERVAREMKWMRFRETLMQRFKWKRFMRNRRKAKKLNYIGDFNVSEHYRQERDELYLRIALAQAVSSMLKRRGFVVLSVRKEPHNWFSLEKPKSISFSKGDRVYDLPLWEALEFVLSQPEDVRSIHP